VPKPLASLLVALMAILPVRPALAAPAGENVIAGEATFTRDGNTTIIDTTTHETIVEYEGGFEILPDEIVQINQPTDDSRILNHVPHGDPTRVSGQLFSNGLVYIINPAGVFFGDTAILDVGGLVAAAGRLDYADFMAGTDRFDALSGDVEVAKQAVIQAERGIALVGRRVASYGTLVTESGYIAMVAGDEALLGSLEGHLIVRVDGGGEPHGEDAGFALTQAGTVDAGAGQVVLSAGDTWSLAMNHTGVTRGRDIQLEAGGGLVQVAGELDASDTQPGGTGGRIQVTGDRVAVLDARLDASGDAGGGEILVGGDLHGAGDVPTARRTYVSAQAELVADAIRAGDGGKIVVWADEATGFYGRASARGGAETGDGGFVEISGREYLEARGHRVDLGAANGDSGTLLYDPERIEIRGGSGDAAPEDDPAGDNDGGNPDELNDGALGRILANDTPTDGTFVIYESEIEGTDADIILQATERVAVGAGESASTFTHQAAGEANGVVVVMPGNSLVIQTTGAPNLAPGEQYAIDLRDDLTWRVDEGGRIFISTSSGDPNNPAPADSADIRVGRLEFLGRAYQTDESTGLSSPLLIDDQDLTALGIDMQTDAAVQVDTDVGNITIGSIATDGDAAGSEGTRPASAAGGVSVLARSGDVTVGSVSAVGGSAVHAVGGDPASPSVGGAGGSVGIQTANGTLTIWGPIDVSGGNGLAGLVPVMGEDSPDPVSGNGGAGGLIVLEAQSLDDAAPQDAQVVVRGDLTASGGVGDGVAGLNGLTFAGIGGSAGAIGIRGEGGVDLDGSGLADGLDIVASGGNGIAGGGSGLPGSSSGGSVSVTIQIQATSEAAAASPGAVEMVDTQIVSNGGNAGNEPGSGVVFAGPGGPGGSGGTVVVDGGLGQVLGAGASIEANGGAGAAGPAGGSPRRGPGGSATSVRLEGDDGVTIGDIEAVGGAGVNGVGGRGGSVVIGSIQGEIVTSGIDVSGGDVVLVDQADLVGVPIPGGSGGDVSLTTGSTGETPEPGGDVRLGGAIDGFGGVGRDADENPAVADGAFVLITTNQGAIENAASDVDAPIRAGSITLTAPRIGALDPIELAGTLAEDDQATLTVTQGLQATLLGVHGPAGDAQAGNGLEDLTVVHAAPVAVTALTSVLPSDPALAVAAGTEDGSARTTVTSMTTGPGSDTALHFVLDEPEEQGAPAQVNDLEVLEGAVSLGTAGGSIENADGRLIAEASGTAAHVATLGNLVLEAATIGDDATPVRIDGGTDAALELRASGAGTATGNIDVDVLDAGGSGAFGAIEVVQADAEGSTTIRGLSGQGGTEPLETLQVTGADVDDLTPVQQLTGSTLASGASFAYRLTAPAPGGGEAPALEVANLDLGGDGLLEVPGDLELVGGAEPSIEIAGGRTLALDAGGDITDDAPNDAADPDPVAPIRIARRDGSAVIPTRLLVDAGGSVGSASNPLVTQGFVGGLETAASFGGDFHLANQAGSELVLTRVDVPDPSDVPGDTTERTLVGVVGRDGSGDVSLANEDRTIVLGAVEVGTAETQPGHVIAGGDVSFGSPVEIANAQFVEVDTDADPDTREVVAVNPGSVAAGGDIAFARTIDTALDNVAEDDAEEDPVDAAAVDAALTLAAGGVVSFAGDVGATRPLARLDTTRAMLPAGDPRSFHAGEAVFRGGLDGPAGAFIEGVGGPGHADRTAVAFGGDVGAGQALHGLTVRADDIDFTVPDGSASATRVVTGEGGIDLATSAAPTPPVATITDTAGNLQFQTSGDFVLGTNDKLSAVGALSIAAAQVTVGDLSASTIAVRSPDIRIRTRAPAAVELPDGSTVMDGGTDWTADSITATSQPVADPGPEPVAFFLGKGSLSIPGDLSGFQVRRLNGDLGGVDPGAFFGQDGAVLDLTGNGPPLIGDPARQAEREARLDLPERPPSLGSDSPAAGPPLAARQVLAFLRCSGVHSGGTDGGCTGEDQAALASVARFDDSALATDRARDITARYHELVGTPAALARLRAAFEAAGAAFGATREWSDGSLDGAELYRFLESDAAQEPALAAVRELAWVFAQIELLGLAGDDTSRLQQTLAQEFADAAGLQGLGADEVVAAVDASPIGLPR
jgi:filamentous hemagglutinin family protein